MLRGRRSAVVGGFTAFAILVTTVPALAGRATYPSSMQNNFGGGVGDELQRRSAVLESPRGVAVDDEGVVYIADTGHNRVRSVGTDETIRGFAGTGATCADPTTDCGDTHMVCCNSQGDPYEVKGYSSAARLNEPWGVAFDPITGSILIADTGHNKLRLVKRDREIVTLAGTGAPTLPDGSNLGNDGSATSATLNRPSGVAVLAGSIVVADTNNNEVRKIENGFIADLAGGSAPDDLPVSGDGLPASFAKLDHPTAVASLLKTTPSPDPLVPSQAVASLLVADTGQNLVRQVDASSGIISSPPGISTEGSTTFTSLQAPAGVTADPSGNIFISDTAHGRVLKLTPLGALSTIAGGGGCGFSGDAHAAVAAELCEPSGIALDAARNKLYIADTGNDRIRVVDLTTGTIDTFAGGGVGDEGPGTNAMLSGPTGLAVSEGGDVYVADPGANRVRRLIAGTNATTYAGTGIAGYEDGSDRTQARLQGPRGVAITGSTVYIADTGNDVVRKVSSSGIITTVGTGALTLSEPNDVAVDGAGDLYISDTGNGRIVRRTSGGSVSVIATGLAEPTGLATHGGLVYVAETGNHRVITVEPMTSTVTVIAGTGSPCLVATSACGDGGAPTAAQLTAPRGVVVDTNGEILIADTGNNKIRDIDAGVIETFAGTGLAAYSGDGGDSKLATLDRPSDVALDPTFVYIADTGNARVRKAG